MKSKDQLRRVVWTYSSAGIAALLFGLFAGCGGKVDDRFAAESYDEYTESLSNAVVGSPAGVVVVGPDGAVTPAPEAPAAARAARVADAGADAGSFPPPPPPPAGSASWNFDDCNPGSNFLADSTGGGANAQHALGAACVPGATGLGVKIRSAKDVVQVPDEPEFTASTNIGVAAWVNPTTVAGDQPIIIKRLNTETAFSLGIHNGNIEMSVVLTTGTTIISRAPIAPGVWTHVGGTFDGTFVFLFINGQQFGQVFGAGTIRDVFAPVRIGATTQTQYFHGIIDNAFVSTETDARDQIIAQSCIAQPSTLAVNPAVGAPTPFDTPAHYDVIVTDNDFGFCQTRFYEAFQPFSDDPNITASLQGFGGTAAPGGTVDFGVDISGNEDANPGDHTISFSVFDFGGTFEDLNASLDFQLVAPSCFVFKKRELMITDTSVVNDPVRTSPTASTPSGSTATPGAWAFGNLMRAAAPSDANAPAMTLALFQHELADQTVNGFTVAARPAIQQTVLDPWPKTPSGDLDLDQAPLTLQAIVSRVDLRNLAAGSAGEARFVFAFNSSFSSSFPINFTVIVEYNLPAQTQDDVLAWANRWHALSSHPFPSEEYNAALEAITDTVTARNAAPSGVNGSGLIELRTNENALSPFGQWELRSFALSAATGSFDEIPVDETPDLGFNGTSTFADFVNQNAAAIEAVVPGATADTVPLAFEGAPFRGGSVFNNFVTWNAFGITDPEARFHASLNTCNGCHGPETNTGFLMINPRFFGQEATLSPFLTGTTVFDFTTGESRTLNDLGRRRDDLTSLVCSGDGGAPSVDAGVPATADVDAIGE
jgi:Concanavalin A-like lectin/glucanases superfamily